jgi:CRP-like cAMP-binding protein
MPIVDSDSVFERLCCFPTLTFEEGDAVLTEGETTGRLLFLIQGAVDVVVDGWHVARVAEPGAVFGDMAALRGRPHSASVLAVRTSTFFVVDDAASCLSSDPLIALYVAVVQSGRLDAANRHLVAARSELAAKGQRHRMCVAALDRIGGALQQAVPATATAAISNPEAAAAARPSERAGAARLHPAAMMQLVEIASVLRTSNAVCDAIRGLTSAPGKATHVSDLRYRFVVNRVLVPMINETIACLHDGLAEPEELDAMLRLDAEPAIGPLALADRIGLDVVLDLLDTLHAATDDPRYRPSPPLRRLVEAGCLGRKSGQGFYKHEH